MALQGVVDTLTKLAKAVYNGDEENNNEKEESPRKNDDDGSNDEDEKVSFLSEDQYFGEEDEEVGNFWLQHYIGSGSFGVVWQAHRKGDEKDVVAIKISRKDELSDREIRMLRSVGEHPNVVRLIDSFPFDDGKRLVMVLNLMETSLFDHRVSYEDLRLPVAEAKEVTRQLLRGLAHLEKAGIVHTDIKPENILVSGSFESSSFVVQLADFGAAGNVNSNDLCVYGKTAPYRAPEILCRAFQCMRSPADLWSMACGVFEVFAGTLLFDAHQSNTYSARSTGSAETSKELNIQQLSLMVELLGKFPRRFALKNRDYFNRKGNLKGVGEIKTIDLRAIMVVECEMKETLANDLYQFLMPMLKYTPRLRARAEKLLEHDFLKNTAQDKEQDFVRGEETPEKTTKQLEREQADGAGPVAGGVVRDEEERKREASDKGGGSKAGE